MTREENRALCEKYPFLMPSSGRIYDYRYTMLDFMPDVWRNAFGEAMCMELKKELDRAGLLGSYMVLEIKEKYGTLRWYDCGGNEKTDEIVSKYEKMSERLSIT